MWLPITEFLSTPVYFLNPDPDMTLTEPSMAPEVLSVSTYNAETTVLRRIRQRLWAHRADPSGLIRSRSQYLHHRRTPYGKQHGCRYHCRSCGSVFQWSVIEGNNRLAESREIRSYFIRGAVRTQGLNYPNREWGYGRLNLEETFNALLRV